MNAFIVLLVITSILFLLFFLGFLNYRKEQRLYKIQLKEEYGSYKPDSIPTEELSRIQYHFEKKTDRTNHIDAITCNDLNLNAVFERINYTKSLCGAERLYEILRSPLTSEEELEKREKTILYFREHEKERIGYQEALHRLGKEQRFTLSSVLDDIANYVPPSLKKDCLMLILYVLSAGITFVNTTFGIILFILLFSINTSLYFKNKKTISHFYIAFSYIYRVFKSYEMIRNLPRSDKDGRSEEIEDAYKKALTLKKTIFFFSLGDNEKGSAGPFSFILDIFKMGFHFDFFILHKAIRQCILYRNQIEIILCCLGEIDALIAIGEYRESLAHYCIPSFTQEKWLYILNGCHPLMTDPVKNTIDSDANILITGSNASGKSTFLKMCALNVILAQTIHTVLADEYKSSFFVVLSSMSIKDDLMMGDSFYMAEIKSLKRILDQSRESSRFILCFVDEVLKGTNTVERIAASAEILEGLCNQNTLAMVATHDMELTELLKDKYENYHFSETICNDELCFSYVIQEGASDTRNAILLLQSMGYPKEVVNRAEKRALMYLSTHTWSSEP